jgi:hypothetical protein
MSSAPTPEGLGSVPGAVLAIGGAESSGAMVADTMQLVADNVQSLIIADCGHWVAEQRPRSCWPP